MKNDYYQIPSTSIPLYFGTIEDIKQEIFETPEKAGGIYYVYLIKKTQITNPPNGYIPFYISHMGRHGSRYLAADDNYRLILNLFKDGNDNNALTTLGVDVYDRLNKVWKEVEWHGGDLTPSGVRENRGIAERMYQSHQEVFNDNTHISAHSTIQPRTILSMDAFCERLKELNPSLQISRKASVKYEQYLNHHTKEAVDFRISKEWFEQYREFREERMYPDRLFNSLFSDTVYTLKKIEPSALMWNLFLIAVGMQNIETDLSFFDIFEKDELFELWQCNNYRLYVNDANSSLNKGLMLENGKPLLQNMLDRANEIIAAKGKGVSLRFAHEGNFVPLTMSLHLQSCYNSVSDPNEIGKAWCDYKITPMAANVQMIFYRKENSDDVLVKFLLNEQETLIPPIESDILPFYHWRDVDTFYQSYLNSRPLKTSQSFIYQ